MDVVGRVTHDSREGGDRIASGTAIEDAKAEFTMRAIHSYLATITIAGLTKRPFNS